MIKGIGCDFVSHSVTKKLKWETDADVLNHIFSAAELVIYRSRKNVRFLAGRYAAKEAVLKCMGSGMEDGLALTDIEILDDENHKPFIVLSGEIKIKAESLEIDSWFVSISHAPAHSLAFIVAESVKRN